MQLKFDLFESLETDPVPESTRYKQCTTCKESLLETEENFYVVHTYYSKNGDTNTHFHNRCKGCFVHSNAAQHYLRKIHGHKAYGKCDCCGVDSKTLRGDKLHLDHCHVTHVYRGHLCGSCNRGIGMLGDDIEGVQQAVNYLKKVELKNEED